MFDRISERLEQYMDLLATRQELVTANIANADTPGYKTKDIDFQFEFQTLLKGESPQVIEAPGLASKNDGNNVSLDREARLLSETAIRFNLASSLIQNDMRMIRTAIQEGKSG
jgi:flagellar basal-body rod protein FlgB